MASALIPSRFRDLFNKIDKQETGTDVRFFGKKVGLLAKIFGCDHRNISRPFVEDKTSYRTCLQCGARKQFNPDTFETFGEFYYPPVERADC